MLAYSGGCSDSRGEEVGIVGYAVRIKAGGVVAAKLCVDDAVGYESFAPPPIGSQGPFQAGGQAPPIHQVTKSWQGEFCGLSSRRKMDMENGVSNVALGKKSLSTKQHH